MAGVREHRGIAWVGAGVAALAAYGLVATSQHGPHVGAALSIGKGSPDDVLRERHRGLSFQSFSFGHRLVEGSIS